MKILIDNRTNLSNKQIGYLLDTIQINKKIWVIYELEYLGKTYHVEILPIKRYLKAFIKEIEDE